MATAFLIDGGFFLKRFRTLQGARSPLEVAKALHAMCLRHLEQDRRRELYRIFYYDCPPLGHKTHHPVSRKAIDFSKTPVATWRLAFFEELKKLRKVALRLGYLNERQAHWTIRPDRLKSLLEGRMRRDDLEDADFEYVFSQKGVDMRLGIDVASLAYKRLVDQIVLVAGDSDFVPAAKLARREGIDLVLDPMWASIREDLHEHIDGLKTVVQRSGATTE